VWGYWFDASIYEYLCCGGDALSSFDHLLKRDILSLIYLKFNSATFTAADVKNAICESYSIAPTDIEKHLRYLFQTAYITTVVGEWPSGHYQFINPFVWNKRTNDKRGSRVKNERCMNTTKIGDDEMVMNDIDVHIWEMGEGKVTSLKIDDAVFPLIGPFDYDTFESNDVRGIDNPIDVARAFVKLFDNKHAREANSFRKWKADGNNDNSWKNNNKLLKNDDDIIECIDGVEIKKTYLKWLYGGLKDRVFTKTDIYNRMHDGMGEFGAVRVHIYLNYLHDNKVICVTQYPKYRIGETYYKFVVPLEKWDFIGNNTEPHKPKLKKENNIIEFPIKNPPDDLIQKAPNGLYITESKLKTIYNTLKNKPPFSVNAARKALHGTPGYSEPVIRACMSYLVKVGYAISRSKNKNKTYTFLVPASKWRFGNKTITSYESPECTPVSKCESDVKTVAPSVKVDFDPGEVRTRRMLEIQTVRGEIH